MARKRKEEELFDSEDSETDSNASALEKVMSLMEDSELEFTIKKVANGKTLTLDNGIVFRFNHEDELSSVDT